MKWLHWFFREWMKRCIRTFSMMAVLGPLVVFVLHANEERIDSPAEWVWAFVAVILPVVFGKSLWRLLWSDDAEKPAPPPTPAQLRQSRLAAVADTVSDLPDGISFQELCLQLDEKQTRRLLHLLHQTRPGERHLRDVLSKLR
ncbi:MAG TPA: hypothetical protein DDZ88_28260 [Verrucomicrobiales bacterium]|nr:hypothetical protein [Verrucomicrobiales bacterium]